MTRQKVAKTGHSDVIVLSVATSTACLSSNRTKKDKSSQVLVFQREATRTSC
ncbi:Hypothetical protein PAU_00755 [Photorhabdus asymbiotica]|uniref:Uncharacterized protein n=1 Tax=Photorhabdus asymbiotica subsp. asymbiotica (strain ATCC 43949 / 3105-77) TaxID=553480 RepID=B6VMK9_PHOAA|nr:Hypothetical protein PAU_00755 [Photorhabdus asymbiotica]CAR67389.1 Hypothetical protein PA-RVA13-1260 [Photorhabdus asymbiotica subsp. asymbiotica ATCC 43949]